MKQETARSLFELACLWAAGVPRDGEKDGVWTRGNIGWICVYIHLSAAGHRIAILEQFARTGRLD